MKLSGKNSRAPLRRLWLDLDFGRVQFVLPGIFQFLVNCTAPGLSCRYCYGIYLLTTPEFVAVFPEERNFL